MSKLLFLSMFLFSSLSFGRELVIISDLDETLRQANTEKKINAGLKLIAGVKKYPGLAAILEELTRKNPNAVFYYVSNSYPFLYGGKRWINKEEIPDGDVIQRSIGDESANFKSKVLQSLALKHPDADFLLFGDNIERDVSFYQEFALTNSSRVYIRDARLIFPEVDGIKFYQHELQLVDELEISQETTRFLKSLSLSQLVPQYLFKNLRQRLIKDCKRANKKSCRRRAVAEVQKIIEILNPVSDPSL